MRIAEPVVRLCCCFNVATKLCALILLFATASLTGCSPIGGDNFGDLLTDRPLVLPTDDDAETVDFVRMDSNDAVSTSFSNELAGADEDRSSFLANRDQSSDVKTLDREQLAKRKAALLDALRVDTLNVAGGSNRTDETRDMIDSGGDVKSVADVVVKQPKSDMITLVASSQPVESRSTEAFQPQDALNVDYVSAEGFSAGEVPAREMQVAADHHLLTPLLQTGVVVDTQLGHEQACCQAPTADDVSVEPELNAAIRTVPDFDDHTMFNAVAEEDALEPNVDWIPPQTRSQLVEMNPQAGNSGQKFRIACCDSPGNCQCERAYAALSTKKQFDKKPVFPPHSHPETTKPVPFVALAKTDEQPIQTGEDKLLLTDFETSRDPAGDKLDASTSGNVQLASFDQVPDHGGDFVAPASAEVESNASRLPAVDVQSTIEKTKVPSLPESTLTQKLQQAIDQLKSDLATLDNSGNANFGAATESVDGRAVSVRLLEMIDRKLNDVQDLRWDLNPNEARYWDHQLDALATMLNDEGDAGGPTTDQQRHERALQALEHLEEAKGQLQSLAGLQIGNGHFCEEVSGFGQYQPFAVNEFKPGDWTLLYIEVKNFRSEAAAAESHVSVGTNDARPDTWRTRLRASYAIYDRQGRAVQQDAFPVIEDVARQRRNDFYLHLPIEISKLPKGQYQLQLVVEDVAAVTAATLQPPMEFVVR